MIYNGTRDLAAISPVPARVEIAPSSHVRPEVDTASFERYLRITMLPYVLGTVWMVAGRRNGRERAQFQSTFTDMNTDIASNTPSP